MASISFTTLGFLLIISIAAFPILSNAARPPHVHHPKPSAFDFLKGLEGCHKGQNKTGLHNLKTYLKHFGYLNYHHTKYESHSHDDEFDDLLESALKTYQSYYHLNSTGTLDSQTLTQMVKPRCGIPDINDGRTHPNSLTGTGPSAFTTVGKRWPPSKTHLTYAFQPNTRADAIGPVSRAFNTWQRALQSRLTFSRTRDLARADIKIGFYRRDHGDGSPFDGPGLGVIAHAFYPPDGRFHYDAEDIFTVNPTPNANHLETVALHEIGHLLGLGHSSDPGAVMFASIETGRAKGLNQDDIRGIRTIYNS